MRWFRQGPDEVLLLLEVDNVDVVLDVEVVLDVVVVLVGVGVDRDSLEVAFSSTFFEDFLRLMSSGSGWGSPDWRDWPRSRLRRCSRCRQCLSTFLFNVLRLMISDCRSVTKFGILTKIFFKNILSFRFTFAQSSGFGVGECRRPSLMFDFRSSCSNFDLLLRFPPMKMFVA